MRKNLSILLLAFVATMSIQSAKAWGTFGHGAIAYVAEQHLTPKAKEECRRYLKHTLPYYASWMDHWRAVPPFHPTNNWHGFSATADGQVNWEKGEGKSMGQLHKIMKEMGNGNYKNLPDSLVRQNLIYLIHMVPDFHCPVHTFFKKGMHTERKYTLKLKGKSYSLHTFWDRSPNIGRTKWTMERYAKEIDVISPKLQKKYMV